MRALAVFLATITLHPRYKVQLHKDFEWSSKSWTHNAFRLFELIFGRRFGSNGIGDTIRIESFGAKIGNTEIHAFYTREAAIAYTETLIREFLTKLKIPKVYVYEPKLASIGGFAVPAGYLFAIARDTDKYSNSTTNPATTHSFSYTCTGSNLLLTNFCYSPKGSDSAAMTSTYNSVSMTSAGFATSTNNCIKSFYLIAPATGANTLAMAASSGYPLAMACISYTGAKQSAQPDSHNETSSNSGNALSVSVTTVADNSWIAGFYYNGLAVGGNFTASGAFVIRHAAAGAPGSGDWATMCSLDTNGAISPAGATSVGCSIPSGSTEVVLTAVGIAPLVVVADTPSVSDSTTTGESSSIMEVDLIYEANPFVAQLVIH